MIIGTAAAIARMVGIITSPHPASNISNAPTAHSPSPSPPPMDEEERKDMINNEIDLENPEFDRPVVVRGTDLPAGT